MISRRTLFGAIAGLFVPRVAPAKSEWVHLPGTTHFLKAGHRVADIPIITDAVPQRYVYVLHNLRELDQMADACGLSRDGAWYKRCRDLICSETPIPPKGTVDNI